MAETKRVRLAIAIDEKGNFTVSGWNGATDDHMRSSVIDFFEPDGSEVDLKVRQYPKEVTA